MPPATRLLALVALSTLVSACSINGTYIDSTRPDAAKLRYISGNGSATLDLFDSARCEGRTTGILNNLFVPDSRRRADMSVPPSSCWGGCRFRQTRALEAADGLLAHK